MKRASKWGPLGITHLKKAELWVKGKDQRERGTCWNISWSWLLISRQRKIQDVPHWNITPAPLPKGLCCLSCPGGKGKEKQIILKHSSTKSISSERKASPMKGPGTWFGIPALFRFHSSQELHRALGSAASHPSRKTTFPTQEPQTSKETKKWLCKRHSELDYTWEQNNWLKLTPLPCLGRFSQFPERNLRSEIDK